MAKFLVKDLSALGVATAPLAFFVAGATFLVGAAGFFAVPLVVAGFFVVFAGAATGFLDATTLPVVLAGFLVADAVLADDVAAGAPPALEFQPNLFNFPTTAFLEIPKRLPISDVDKPLPIRDFSFFSVALSQPLLILKNPCYTLWYKCSIVSNRKARGKNMISYIFFIILLVAAVACLWQISVADWRRRIIPDAYLWPLLLIGLIIVNWSPFWIVGPRLAAASAAIGYTLAAGVGFVFDYLRRKKNPDADTPIGMGDIKLIAVGGLWLGPTGLYLALIMACILGIAWGKWRHQKYIPFAPFFAIGGFLALITVVFLI